MKILHVTDNYTRQGGAEQYILSVARLMADHGHENAVVYTRRSDLAITDETWSAYHVPDDEGMDVPVRRILDLESPDVAFIHHVSSPRLIQQIASRLPAVAYVHGFPAVCPGLAKYYRRNDSVCTRPFGWGCAPMNYWRRCSAARHPKTLARLMENTAKLKHALLKVPRFLVGSTYMADLLAQNGFPPRQITILPPHFVPDNADTTYAPPEQPTCILFAGRLEIEKGLPYLFQALCELPAAVKLIVAGDGTQRTAYAAMLQTLKLGDRVEFVGWMDQERLAALHRRCSVVVMPSIFPESFGKSGVEALTHGRPVVAFNVGGIADWLQDGINGFLVKPRDVKGLADKIGELVTDEDLRTRLGKAGQKTVIQKYRASQHLIGLLAAFSSAARERIGADLDGPNSADLAQ